MSKLLVLTVCIFAVTHASAKNKEDCEKGGGKWHSAGGTDAEKGACVYGSITADLERNISISRNGDAGQTGSGIIAPKPVRNGDKSVVK